MFVFSLSVLETGPICSSVNTFLIRFRFLRGSNWNKSVKVYPLILLLSMSMLLNFFLFFSTWMSCLAPSLSMSLFESWISSREAQSAMNSQIFLHPMELILLLDKLRTCKLCFFLLESALMTMATPSSPMLFPLRLSSFIVLLRPRQSSRALIP